GDLGRVDLGQRARVLGRVDAQVGVDPLDLGQVLGYEVVEQVVRRKAVEVLGQTGQPDAQTGRPGSAGDQLTVNGTDQGRGVRGRAEQDVVALADVEAPLAQEPGEGISVDHGAWSSGKCSAACSRSVSRTNRRSSAVAIR